MAKKRCAKCGTTVDHYSYGDFCDRCADEVWDAGFESTTQHAEEIAKHQEEDLEEINRMANKARVAYKKLSDSVEWKQGTWRCGKCKYVRMKSDQFIELKKDKAKLVEAFKTPCPKCKVKGFLTFE